MSAVFGSLRTLSATRILNAAFKENGYNLGLDLCAGLQCIKVAFEYKKDQRRIVSGGASTDLILTGAARP